MLGAARSSSGCAELPSIRRPMIRVEVAEATGKAGEAMPVMAATTFDVGVALVAAVAQLGVLLIAIAIIGVVLFPAMLADSKGHSYWGFFFLSIIAFPIALLIALALTDRSTEVEVGSEVRFPRTVGFSDGGSIHEDHRSTVLAMAPTPERMAVLVTAPDGRNRWIDRAAVKPV